MRGSRGPRQPGGGKQSAGPRHRHGSRHPEVRAKRATKSAAADLAPRSSKSGKPDFGRGHGPGPSPARSARFAPPQAGEGGERSSPGEGRQGRASFKQVPRPPQDDRKQQRFSSPSLSVAVESPSGGGKPTTVQNVAVTGDEAGMRVIRKGELRVNGKRTQPKNRLEAGQTVRMPPLRLDQPKPRAPGNEADEKTRAFLKSITLYEDADVLVLNKPMGLAVQGGSGTTRHLDGMLEVLRDAHGQRPRLVHRLDK